MTNGFVPKVPEERRTIDWVKLNAETFSDLDSYKDVYRIDTRISDLDSDKDVYRIDTRISLVADKITEAQAKIIRDWLISQGWTPPENSRWSK